MKKLSLLFIVAILAIGVATTSCDAKSSVKLKNDVDSISYILGTQIGQNLSGMPGEKPNLDALLAGLRDALNNDSLAIKMDPMALQMYMQNYFMAAQAKEGEKNKAEGQKFLEENKKKEGVQTTASGLQYKVVKEGTGPKPTATDRVKVNYVGKLIDGTKFDASEDHGGPAEFGVGQVIAGWTEGLQLMPAGSKYMLYLPSEIAYGEQGSQKIKPNSVLVFEVELLEIIPDTTTIEPTIIK